MAFLNLQRGSVTRYAPGGTGEYETGAYCVACPPKLDNPIDVQLYKHIDVLLPIFNKYNLTPNHLTAVSLVFGVFASYFLYYDKYFLSSISWFMDYYFDCVLF
jgi:hypothetical protein